MWVFCAGGQVWIKTAVCNHTFRGTGITAYLENGGTLERAQSMANHASTRTTQLYDRRSDKATLDDVERLGLARWTLHACASAATSGI